MNFIPYFIRRAWRNIGLRFGWIKQRRYKPDPLLADTINQIVNSDAAYIVAAETRQAMLQVLSYMEKNNIPAVGVCHMDLGGFRQFTLPAAIKFMHYSPMDCRVVVIVKTMAATGWSVPEAYVRHWGQVKLLATFVAREPWKTQFIGRLRRSV
jgi:hypothetical protein